MKKFETGTTYTMRSVCDHNAVWSFDVLRRTAKTVWLIVDGNVRSFRVKVWNDCEEIMPLGSYSMAPRLTADSVAA